jgi:hypothetical protein
MRLFTKENFARLDENERADLMYLQMHPGGRRSPNLPDDCVECAACGYPSLAGWCKDCSEVFERLVAKATGGMA